MFTTTAQLKNFILWAKKQGIRELKVDNVEIKFSELVFLPSNELKDMSLGGASTLADTEQLSQEEQDDLLYHSSGA